MKGLAVLLVVIAACDAFPISARDLAGSYVMNRGAAADTLILEPGGHYRRSYALPGQPSIVDEGSWTSDTLHGEKYVTFTSFWRRWRNETEAGGLRRSPLVSEIWMAPLLRSMNGRIQLMVDEDLQWAYRQVAAAPRHKKPAASVD